jgi:ubiquinol-cytochrome c reductase cytochrome c subunit
MSAPAIGRTRKIALATAPVLITVLVMVVLLLRAPAAAGGAATQPGTTSPDAALVQQGEALYLRSCVSCHKARGTGSDDGPALVAAGEASTDFYLRTGRMPLAAPAPQPLDKRPAYTDGEIRALVAYVGTLCEVKNYPCPKVPPIDVAKGDLDEGAELFLANCAPCHNSVGVGGALSTGNVAPSLQQTKATQVGEAMRIGPGQMPQFGPDVLSDAQVDSIVRYVEYLHEPQSPGGLSLGYVGPVAEGFVALLLGLGALLLSIRWITREPREALDRGGEAS